MEKFMNILFMTAPEPKKSPFFLKEKRPPLGLGFLVSILRNEGHKLFFIDNYLKPSNFIEENYLQKNEIDIVGIQINTICYKPAMDMLYKIQSLREKKLWNGKIIVGGPHCSVLPETIPEFVDYIVQGEGEQATLEIIHGKVKERLVRKERIKNLDKLPFQPWDLFSKLPYDFSCEWLDTKPVFTLNTSRGCPFSCAFCSVGSIWGKQYTFFSAERIIEEIKYLLRNHNAKGIYFREDNFTLKKSRVMEFCEKLLKENLNIQWACETRVDTIDEELIKLMSKSGCKAVYLGVESGSQKVLDALNKNITVGQITNATNLCKKYKIRTYWSLLVGTPFDGYEDFVKTLKLVRKLKPYFLCFNLFVGIPNSPLYTYIEKNKLYEYKENFLQYPPGFDIKSKFFYGKDSSFFVDYKFTKRTDFDKKLEKLLWRKKFFIKVQKIVGKFLPRIIKKEIKKWLPLHLLVL